MKIYMFGAGYMAKEYLNVIKDLNLDVVAISQTSNSAQSIKNEYNIECLEGGYLSFDSEISDEDIAIVCIPVEKLFSCTKFLIKKGFKKILVEKPGALKINDLEELKSLSLKYSSEVLIAYNRRYFSSVEYLRKILTKEKLVAVNFEISEWTHLMELDDYDDEVLKFWFISNTSHVADLVFNISGIPTDLTCTKSGFLDWHPSGSRFAGSGLTEKNVILSYRGFWDSPGRWSVEFLTKNNKYILCPMEKLSCQKKGSIEINDINEIDYQLDENYKPGVFKMFESFINGDYSNLCSLEEQIQLIKVYSKMAGYET
tara:strand:+ start:504 stop:1445 length:942 start_codon:yes stop_codon:yes gene_type:complete